MKYYPAEAHYEKNDFILIFHTFRYLRLQCVKKLHGNKRHPFHKYHVTPDSIRAFNSFSLQLILFRHQFDITYRHKALIQSPLVGLQMYILESVNTIQCDVRDAFPRIQDRANRPSYGLRFPKIPI